VGWAPGAREVGGADPILPGLVCSFETGAPPPGAKGILSHPQGGAKPRASFGSAL